jgi:hypothetical protein
LDRAELIEGWRREEKAPFSGWDFSHLEGRQIESIAPWDYAKEARRLVQDSHAVLDIATGGGENFSSLGPFPGVAKAVEGYAPNVAVAQARLRDLNVEVTGCGDAGPFPFKDGEFDLVLNRHGGCWSPEIGRVTRSGGAFLTQQVAGDNLNELLEAFGAKNPWPENTLFFVKEKLEGMNFEVWEAGSWFGKIRYMDVGAVVYGLKAAAWLVPGFSVDSHLQNLLKLQNRLETEGSLEFKTSRFYIFARKI